MNCKLTNLLLVLSMSKRFCRNNPYYTFLWLFIVYARHRLKYLSSKRTEIHSISDKVHAKLLKLVCEKCTNYVDYEGCALGKFEGMENNSTLWSIVCSKVTHKKYKVLIVSYEKCEEGKILISETMKFNLENTLCHSLDETSYFVIPGIDDEVCCAAEARISLILNPYDCPNDMINCLLETYFKVPRYLRAKNVFGVNLKEYAPDYFYSSANPNLNKVYFRVNALRIKQKGLIHNTRKLCYVMKGETTLIEETNIHSYLPREFTEAIDVQIHLLFREIIEVCEIANIPPSLEKSMEELTACVTPFLQKGREKNAINLRQVKKLPKIWEDLHARKFVENNYIRMKIRPVFLVSGSTGSGKFKLIQSLARRTGLNLLNVDFAEIQSLSAPQTEARLRIVLQNAKNSVPCILRLSNIQIFGKNSEGQKDERIVTAFASELKKLNERKSTYPLIVIATLESDNVLDADIERLFIETINIENLDQSRRSDTLSWILKTKGLRHETDLTKIAGLASDFDYADLDALVTQTATISYQSSPATLIPLFLTHNHFIEAYEYMQVQSSDRIGAPRIPKVYWEDIGGLANLKHEIKRRIELPMLTGMNLGRTGLLLYGPPGTGKTLLAKAVATECQLHFMSIKGPELLNMYVGQSEKNIRQVFERARAAAPCVIFFDELDSLAPNRGNSGDSGGVMDRVVSQLLAEMDGLETSGSIFIIGATNRPDLIDPALLRPGRFDKMLYVGIYNDRDNQLSVLRAVTRRFKMRDSGNELESLVNDLPGNLTGADLYAVCSDAWLLAVRRNLLDLEKIEDDETREINRATTYKDGVIVELQDFVEASRNLVPSVSNAELARYEKLQAELSSS